MQTVREAAPCTSGARQRGGGAVDEGGGGGESCCDEVAREGWEEGGGGWSLDGRTVGPLCLVGSSPAGRRGVFFWLIGAGTDQRVLQACFVSVAVAFEEREERRKEREER